MLFDLFWCAVFYLSRGDYTGEEMLIYYSRSPLSEPESNDYVLFSDVQVVGEIHRRGDFITTLVLPSLNRKICRCFLMNVFRVGEITQGSIL